MSDNQQVTVQEWLSDMKDLETKHIGLNVNDLQAASNLYSLRQRFVWQAIKFLLERLALQDEKGAEK